MCRPAIVCAFIFCILMLAPASPAIAEAQSPPGLLQLLARCRASRVAFVDMGGPEWGVPVGRPDSLWMDSLLKVVARSQTHSIPRPAGDCTFYPIIDFYFRSTPWSETGPQLRISIGCDSFEVREGVAPPARGRLGDERIHLLKEMFCYVPAVEALPGQSPPDSMEEALPEFGARVEADQLPQAISKVAPDQWGLSHLNQGSSWVVVWALVSRCGRVLKTRIAAPGDPALDRRAAEAVSRWRFTPAFRDGKNIAIWVRVPIRFHSGH